MKIFDKIKKSYNNYINKLAKINEEEFGKGGLDCCELNETKKDSKVK